MTYFGGVNELKHQSGRRGFRIRRLERPDPPLPQAHRFLNWIEALLTNLRAETGPNPCQLMWISHL